MSDLERFKVLIDCQDKQIEIMMKLIQDMQKQIDMLYDHYVNED